MKKLFILISLLTLPFLKAQSNTSKEIELTIENMFEDVFSKFEENSLDKYFTKDAVLFEDGNILNHDSIRLLVVDVKKKFDDEATKGHKLERKNKFEFMNTIVTNHTAFVYYKNSADFIYDGISIASINWLESARLEKDGDGWKISFLHSTQIKNE